MNRATYDEWLNDGTSEMFFASNGYDCVVKSSSVYAKRGYIRIPMEHVITYIPEKIGSFDFGFHVEGEFVSVERIKNDNGYHDIDEEMLIEFEFEHGDENGSLWTRERTHSFASSAQGYRQNTGNAFNNHEESIVRELSDLAYNLRMLQYQTELLVQLVGGVFTVPVFYGNFSNPEDPARSRVPVTDALLAAFPDDTEFLRRDYRINRNTKYFIPLRTLQMSVFQYPIAPSEHETLTACNYISRIWSCYRSKYDHETMRTKFGVSPDDIKKMLEIKETTGIGAMLDAYADGMPINDVLLTFPHD